MTDTENLPVQDRLERLEKKLKLSNLLTGKKFADLELTMGKLGESLKEISSDFPEIKERSEEIENLLNIINLGIFKYKENFNDLNSRLTQFERIPEEVRAKLSNFEEKLKSLEENINKISTSLSAFETLKEDITKTVEEKILPRVQTLNVSSEENKVEIEHIKKSIDAFSSAMRSFERTVELTSLDVVIKRFDSIEDKIMKTQSQMEEFRNALSSMSIKDKDFEILKQKIRETESVVLDKLGKLNEIETKINILQKKLEDLKVFDIGNKLKSESKVRESLALDNQARIQELTKRFDMLSHYLEKKVGEIGKMKVGQPVKSGETEEVYNRMEEMYKDMLKRISDMKGLDKELRDVELPPSLNKTISKFEERLDKLDKNYNEIIGVMEDLMKSVKERASGKEKIEGIDDLIKRMKEMEKVLTSWNKNITDYRKQMEERIHKIEKKKVGERLPKNIAEEISSLKEIMSKISLENKDFRKLAREIRVNQMASVEPETFANFANKVSDLEKKILEVEEMSRGSATQTNRIEDLNKLKKEVEDKIKQLEKKISKGSSVEPIILE